MCEVSFSLDLEEAQGAVGLPDFRSPRRPHPAPGGPTLISRASSRLLSHLRLTPTSCPAAVTQPTSERYSEMISATGPSQRLMELNFNAGSTKCE